MKPCPRCDTLNLPDAKFCKQCGLAFDSIEGIATRLVNSIESIGMSAMRQLLPRRQQSIDQLFKNHDRLLIGRDADSDVVLAHPTISRHHAVLSRHQTHIVITDLGSVNGVYVNSTRIYAPTRLSDGDKVGIGPFLFSLAGGIFLTVDSSQQLRLEARNLEKTVRLSDGSSRQLIGGIDLVIEPGEFVSLLGPSGAGKSTLMDCLNGRRHATAGQVLANGEDFYQHYASFRQSIGYVPQKDIIHTQLTVERALHYTACLRLPSDTRQAERDARIEEVLKLMELVPHRATLVSELSGGQIKRVSLGAELIAEPCLLYIDEATSGLDAGTEARMMRLFRRLSDEGRSVVCITHNIENVDSCHLIAVLVRGRLVYFGPPSEAARHFGVKRLNEVYDHLATKSPQEWETQFHATEQYHEFIIDRLDKPERTLIHSADGVLRIQDQGQEEIEATVIVAPASLEDTTAIIGPIDPESGMLMAEASTERQTNSMGDLPSGSLLNSGEVQAIRAIPQPPRPPFFHQFRILTLRYLELIWSDQRSLILLLLQAPVVASILLLGFVNKPYEDKIVWPRTLTGIERTMLTTVARELPPSKEREMLNSMLASGAAFVPDELIVNPRFNFMLWFVLAMVVMWLGCNNSAKEIVKESSIYARERAINLSLFPYLASKFWVQSLLSIIQVTILFVCLIGVLELFHYWFGHQRPYSGYHIPYWQLLGVLWLLASTGVALGLLLSAVVNSTDRANTLLPYVLIPQIILGGGLIMIQGQPLLLIATLFSPVYWAFRAIKAHETELPITLADTYDDLLWLPCAALVFQMVMLLCVAALCLRAKDLRSR